MKETLKDIKELTSGLYASGESERVAQELFEADDLACRFEAIAPHCDLIRDIKADLAGRLSAKRNFNRWIIRSVAMAACVMFAFTLTSRVYLHKEPVRGQSEPRTAVAAAPATGNTVVAMAWDDDADPVSVLSTKLSNIETALYQTDDNYYEAEFSIADIEMQVSDLQGLFWKG